MLENLIDFKRDGIPFELDDAIFYTNSKKSCPSLFTTKTRNYSATLCALGEFAHPEMPRGLLRWQSDSSCRYLPAVLGKYP